MENKIIELANYQILSEKLYEIVKGENYDDVIKATELLVHTLGRRSVVN
jgi:hypothetical protein